MSTSILITGGGGCLPGFKRRVKSEIKAIIQRSLEDGRYDPLSVADTNAKESTTTTIVGDSMGNKSPKKDRDDQDTPAANPLKAAPKAKQEKVKTIHQTPYETLVGLKEGIKLVNYDEDGKGKEETGWNAGLIPWIGGSLAG
jgi:actin-related protein